MLAHVIPAWERTAFFSAAVFVLGMHLLFNVWYALGAIVTRGRPRLEVLHLISLVYGVIAENAAFACPLTLLEKWCLARGGFAPYRGTFELHYLRALVAPHFPLWLLQWGAVFVFAVNVAVYARRLARHHAAHRHAA